MEVIYKPPVTGTQNPPPGAPCGAYRGFPL